MSDPLDGERETRRPGDLRTSLVDVSKDYIKARITSGEFPPGNRLKERDLSAELGISRIPIREAIRDLSTEGFITLLPRRGATVSQLLPGDLDDIFEVRMALEETECVLAAQRATDEEIARMRESVAVAYTARERGDREALNTANGEFHDLLVGMGHNPVLAQVLEPLRNRVLWLLRQSKDIEVICHEHVQILEAIAARDAVQARRLAQLHVETSRRVVAEVLLEQQKRLSD